VTTLTPREFDVLRALAKLGMAKAAARELGISAASVNDHCRSIYRKLEVHNQVRCVVVAFQRGLWP
jgi:DNA-binding NarL/FixJ family response regulator